LDTLYVECQEFFIHTLLNIFVNAMRLLTPITYSPLQALESGLTT